MRRLPILLLATVLLLAAAACGDDDGSGTETETGELSSSEFADQAGKECEEATSKLDALSSSGDPLADQYDETEVIASDLVANVDQLVPPEDEQETVDKMLDGFREYGDAAKRASEAIAGGADEATEQQTFESDAQSALQESTDAANELDISACADLVPSG